MNVEISKLPDNLWAFHTLKEEELGVCFQHEVRRVWGDRPLWAWLDKPWLDLNPEQRTECASLYPPFGYIEPAIRAAPRKVTGGSALMKAMRKANEALIRYGEELQRKRNPMWAPPIETVTVAIDWRESKTKILGDHANLIDEKRMQWGTSAWQYRGMHTRGGRPRDVKRRLVDLAVYRAHRAKLGSKEAVKLLGPLLKSFGFLNNNLDVHEGLFSEKNWATTVREATETCLKDAEI